MRDLIDRQELLRQIDIDACDEPGYYGDTWKFIDTIKSMPSATDINVGTKLGTNLAEVGMDCISRQTAIDALRDWEMCYDWDEHCREEPKAPWVVSPSGVINKLPSAQPQRTCVNCGRTVNNGGWYADGGTRCPIEEHYALPKDGFCHLWEKRNVTDDDYPERRIDD